MNLTLPVLGCSDGHIGKGRQDNIHLSNQIVYPHLVVEYFLEPLS